MRKGCRLPDDRERSDAERPPKGDGLRKDLAAGSGGEHRAGSRCESQGGPEREDGRLLFRANRKRSDQKTWRLRSSTIAACGTRRVTRCSICSNASVAIGTSRTLGPAMQTAYRRIMAPENDPQRIVDPLDLYRQGAPGGPLTMSGVGRLKGVLEAVRKSTDDAAVNRVKSSMLSYANEKLTYTIPGVPGVLARQARPEGHDAIQQRVRAPDLRLPTTLISRPGTIRGTRTRRLRKRMSTR